LEISVVTINLTVIFRNSIALRWMDIKMLSSVGHLKKPLFNVSVDCVTEICSKLNRKPEIKQCPKTESSHTKASDM
jgi:hypothetical protein